MVTPESGIGPEVCRIVFLSSVSGVCALLCVSVCIAQIDKWVGNDLFISTGLNDADKDQYAVEVWQTYRELLTITHRHKHMKAL